MKFFNLFRRGGVAQKGIADDEIAAILSPPVSQIKGPPVTEEMRRMFSPWGYAVGIIVDFQLGIVVYFEDGRKIDFIPVVTP